jgi:hypothetical protein
MSEYCRHLTRLCVEDCRDITENSLGGVLGNILFLIRVSITAI